MLKKFLMPGLLALAALLSEPAAAQVFEPCADAASFPVLAGSLCIESAVPLDAGGASTADKEMIELFVRKFPAANPDRRRGEIWLVAGGPGEPGASFLPVLPVLKRAFPDHDLIIPDHRGTGYSSKICPREEAPESDAGIALAGQEWGPCIGFMHANAARTRAFTITNAAHDLSALIARHRGAGEVYLYGVSYGTQLILRMMHAVPAKVDGIILDGLVPPEADQRWDLSRRTQVVDSVGRATLKPEQTERYRTLLAQKEPGWSAAVPGGDLRRFMGHLLSFSDLRDQIPTIIDGLLRNDTSPLAQVTADLQGRMEALGAYPQSPPSMPLIMLIGGSENNHRRDLTASIVTEEAKDALFTSAIPGLLVGSPAPLYDRDAFFGHVPARLPRTLVIHGTLDPNTPYEGAQLHAAALAGAGGDVRFTTVTGAAHFLPLVAPDCFVKVVSRFMTAGSAPDRCEAKAVSVSAKR